MSNDQQREPESDLPAGTAEQGTAEQGAAEQGTAEQSARGPTPQAEAPALSPAELEDRWRRALADLDNLRKRCAKELAMARQAERADVAAAWLPVLDNLELALTHAEADPASILEGVRAVRDQAVDVLNRLGYPRHDELGVPFDPTRHEVVSVVEDADAPPGTVVRVLRPGYGEGERQLRPVAVAVSKGRE